MPKMTELKYAEPWREVASTPADWKALGKFEALRMLQHLHLVRAFEESVLSLEKLGLVHGPAHSSIGQEGGAVGSTVLMNSGDMITGSHRGHHQFLGKGLKHLEGNGYDLRETTVPDRVRNFLYRTMAEILGLADGFCEGRGGSMHLRWPEAGAMGTNAIVGGGVPIANGLAWAQKRRKKSEVTFTYFGDGATNIGAVPESMNLAALWGLPICFFIENNGYAVSTTLPEETRETRLSSRGGAYAIPAFRVDGMDPLAVRLASAMAIDHMRAGKGPTIIEAVVYRYFHHGGSVPGSAFGYRKKEEETAWIERDPITRTVGEMIALKWLSKGDSEAIRVRAQQAMDEILGRLTDGQSTARTIRAELWPKVEFRDVGIRGTLKEFDGVAYSELESTGQATAEVKFVDAIAKVMERRMEADDRIFCMGEDIHRLKGGTNGATKGLADRFPDRIIPTPIAEQGFVGLAGGVALEGSYRPVVELMYADFSLVAADQLFNQIAKARHMFGGASPMPIVVRTKCAMGTGYGSQHSMDPAGLYAMWPGWRIVAPSTPYDYVGLMNSALRCEDPVLMIEHTDLYNTMGPGPVDNHDYYIQLGKAKVVRPGAGFTALSYLSMTGLARKVADEMGADVEIVDLRSLDRAGIDWDTIGDSIRKTNNVVVIEQGPLTCSYGAMLTDEIQRRFFDYLDQPVQRIHGGEASPSVSKVLERSAFVGVGGIRAGFEGVMRNMGL